MTVVSYFEESSANTTTDFERRNKDVVPIQVGDDLEPAVERDYLPFDVFLEDAGTSIQSRSYHMVCGGRTQ